MVTGTRRMWVGVGLCECAGQHTAGYARNAPPPLEMRIDRNDLVMEMETNGFRLETEHTFLPHQ